MAIYLIGDIQGCHGALTQLLAQLDASPSRDQLYVLGDLLNRGPDNLGVLRTLQRWGHSALCLLGNHDIHALAVHAGVRKPHRQDTLHDVLQAPDVAMHMAWLRQQPLARQAHGWLMVHAGVLPQWQPQDVLAYAAAVSARLQAPDWADSLPSLFGNEPAQWREGLSESERLRIGVNALTRLRFCDAHGRMDFATKDGAAQPPEGLMPWFEVPGRQTTGTPIAFGHWSTLGLKQAPGLLGLDTGCVWGGQLSAAELRPQPSGVATVGSVTMQRCPQAQVPQTR